MNDVIRIENLNFNYPDGIKALKDINLSIYRGESVGIIGPNGAGKSTLLLCLNGVLRGIGKIVIDGVELNDKNIFSIRKKVGLVFQDPDDQLFNPTVYDDVSFGPVQMDFSKEEIEQRTKSALSSVDMTGYEKRMSGHLSFGEKKRIALATVLSMEPKILALDEPTSNLDPKGRRDFIELLKTMDITAANAPGMPGDTGFLRAFRRPKGCIPVGQSSTELRTTSAHTGVASLTVLARVDPKDRTLTKIIATHDLEMVLELCSKAIVLDKGKIVSSGNTLDILSNEDLLVSHNLELPLSLIAVPG